MAREEGVVRRGEALPQRGGRAGGDEDEVAGVKEGGVRGVSDAGAPNLVAGLVGEGELAVGGELELGPSLDRVVAVGKPDNGLGGGGVVPDGEEEEGGVGVERTEAEGEVAGGGGPGVG